MMELVPERLRGETATFDIIAGSDVVVEKVVALPHVTFVSWKSLTAIKLKYR